MTIVAHNYRYVIGVDTHVRTNTYAILSVTGEHIATDTFPNTTAGIKRAIAWGDRRAADGPSLWSVEGAASYGSELATTLTTDNYSLVEAPRMSARSRRGLGKSDPLDARAIAAATLTTPIDQLRHPRQSDGHRHAVRVLLTARADITDERTQKVNALTALLRTNALGVDARNPLTDIHITQIAAWRERNEPVEQAIARQEARRLATRITGLDQAKRDNERQLAELIRATPAASLLTLTGVGPVIAATVYSVWSHHGRVKSEAAFAAIAGVNTIPASSGNTIRHRLNRGGDRKLNRALYLATMIRTRCDEETKEYIARKTAQGRSKREIRRSLKRYLARKMFRMLNAAEITT